MRLARALRMLTPVAMAAAMLVLIELGLRFAGLPEQPPPPDAARIATGIDTAIIDDRDLIFAMRPGAEFLGYYSINARGWRGREPLVPKPENALRVVCVGDSMTMGVGVREEEAWPQQLEGMLEHTLGDIYAVEVINTGIVGYTSWQNRVQLERDVSELQPDVVVVLAPGVNDADPTEGFTDAEMGARNAGFMTSLSDLHLLRIMGYRMDFSARGDDPDLRARVTLEEFERNLRGMADAAHDVGAPIVFIAPPRSSKYAGEPHLIAADAALERVIADRDTLRADPRPLFDAYAGDPLFKDGNHPASPGHQAIALSVLTTLIETPGLLDRDSRTGFVRTWLAARRDGLAASPVPVDSSVWRSGPPVFLPILQAYRGGPSINQRLRDEDPTLPEAVRRFDPLYGSERGAYGEGALRTLAARQLAQDPSQDVDDLLARADAMRAQVRQRDVYARLLAGSGLMSGPVVAPSGMGSRITSLARALTVFDRLVGATELQRDERFFLAEQREAEGDVDGALALLEEILALAPRSIEGLVARATLLRRHGRGKEGVRDLARAVAIAPDDARPYIERAVQDLRAGRLDDAEPALRRALELEPMAARARYMLAKLLLERGDPPSLREARDLLLTVRTMSRRGFRELPEVLAEVERRLQEAESRGQQP